MSFVDDIVPANASSAVITSTFEAKVPDGLVMDPPELYFGALVVGEDQLVRTFKTTNVGKKTLRIVSVVLNGPEQFLMTGTPPETLKPGASFEMSVQYLSNMPGLFAGMVVITTNQEGPPYYLGLSGRVVGSLYLEEVYGEFKALVDQEAWARATADLAEAGKRLELEASMGDEINAKVLQESIARVTADEALAYDITQLTATVDGNTASITQEAIVRSNADEAMAARIETLEATSGDDIDEVARAAIEQEAIVRADADSAEATIRAEQIASVRYVRGNMLYNGGFEHGLDGWDGDLASWTVTDDDWGRSLRSKNPPVGGQQIFSSWARRFKVVPGEAYTASADSMLKATSGTVQFDITFMDDAGTWTGSSPPGAINGAHTFKTNPTNREAHTTEGIAPPGSTTAVVRFVWFSLVGCTDIGFRQVKVERGHKPATPYTKDASDQQTVANIVTETNARVAGDAAEASARQALEATMKSGDASLDAKITNESSARVAGDQAEATARNQLAVTLRSETDQKVSAAVTNEATARANADTAYANAQQVVNTNLSNQTSQVRTDATAGINAVNNTVMSMYSVTLTANGLAGGFKFMNNGAAVALTFDVDSFAIGRTGANARKPFYMQNNVVYMDQAVIQSLQFNKLQNSSGTFVVQGERLQAAHIYAATLSAFSADLGNITAGNLNLANTTDSSGYAYARSYGKWWGDNGNGWVLARNSNDGSTFIDFYAGGSRFWMSSWGDCGLQFPGITLTQNGGVNLYQTNVINTGNITNDACSLLGSVSGTATTIATTIGVPAGETWKLTCLAMESNYSGPSNIGAGHQMSVGCWNGSNFTNAIGVYAIPVYYYYDSGATVQEPSVTAIFNVTLTGPINQQIAVQGNSRGPQGFPTTKTLVVLMSKK